MTVRWKRYLTAFLLNLAVTLVVLWLRGFDLKIYYVDALSVAGAVSVLLGLLIWVTDAGAFDTIGYGFSTFRSNRRDKDLFEYVTRKREARKRKGKPYLPFLITGAVFLLISFLVAAV